MWSRVVPAMALSIAFLLPTIRLKSVDLPVLGLPMMATVGSMNVENDSLSVVK